MNARLQMLSHEVEQLLGRGFYPVRLLIMAVACARVPPLLICGPATRLERRLCENQPRL